MLQVFGPLRTTDCFLSIGTGIPQANPLPSVRHPIDFAMGIVDIATNSEIINIMFRSLINAFAPRGMDKKYWRLNVGDGLPDWVEVDGVWQWKLQAERKEENIGKLDDVSMIDLTKQRAGEYLKLAETGTTLRECSRALAGPCQA